MRGHHVLQETGVRVYCEACVNKAHSCTENFISAPLMLSLTLQFVLIAATIDIEKWVELGISATNKLFVPKVRSVSIKICVLSRLWWQPKFCCKQRRCSPIGTLVDYVSW